MERPQLLTRSFDRELLVKNIGTYNYHIYDLFIQSKSHAQRALADGSELVEVGNYINANYAAPIQKCMDLRKGVISLRSRLNPCSHLLLMKKWMAMSLHHF